MLSEINFTTTISDLFDRNGKRLPSELGRGVYRDDTGECIATCGRTHKTVDHMAVINPILNHFNDQGYEVVEREADLHSLYDLKGRKGVFVSAKTDSLGAVMRADIISGDFIEPKARFGGNNKAGDNTMFHRISLLNSHNGSLAVQCNNSYLRLVCLNGMTTADWSTSTRAKHTINLNIEALKSKIRNGLSMMADDAERFGQYAKTKVTLEQATEFFQRTIAKLAQTSDGKARWSEPMVQQMLVNFRQEDKTVWGVWNAMTAWATHGERRANTSALSTTLGREARVADAMRSQHFAALLKA
jgi:hypothetical protein